MPEGLAHYAQQWVDAKEWELVLSYDAVVQAYQGL